MELSKVKMAPGAAKEMQSGLMKYQYEQIIKHLMLLQDHAAARYCPYTPTGEMCIRKHLMALEAYAQETIPMEEEPAFREKLENLLAEASNNRLNQEAVLCGDKEQFLEGIEHWARRWRKEFELHSIICKSPEAAAGARKPAAEKVPQPEPEKAAVPGV